MQFADGTSPISYTVTGSITGRRVSMTSYTIKALVPEWTVTPDPLSSTNIRTGKITSTNSAKSKMGVYYGERELARSTNEIAFGKVDLIVSQGPGTNGGPPLPEDRQPNGGTAPTPNELDPGTIALLYHQDQTNRVATTLTLKGDPTGGSVTLDQHGLTDLKIYSDGALHEELTLPKTWTNGDTPPSTLYMVGSSSSTNLQSAQGTLDLIYKTTLAADGGEYSIKDAVGVTLLPFELISDLNNNGMIDGGDRTLKSDGAKPEATDEQKEKATEYIFANDNVSNGAWDKDDPSSDKPQDAKDDDDAEEISVTCAATWGVVWFEHPAIEKLSFYKSKECKADEKVTFPFPLSTEASGKLPEKLYVRLDGTGFTAQAVGDLVMKFGNDQQTPLVDDKIKFTAIKQLGDEKFFQAARDYIGERNAKLFAHNWGYPVASPSTFIRMCVMREEATTMHPYESYHNDAVVNYNQASPGGTAYFDPVLYAQGLGIEGVMSVNEEMTVVINGNQCAFSNGTGTVEAYAMFLLGEPLMTDKCQGRVVIGGSLNPASNDHYDPATNAPGTSMKGSYLAGPDPIPGTGGPGGKYIAQTGNAFQVGAGVLPSTVNNGMGGLSSSYNLGERSGYPNSMVGYVPMAGDGKGVVFTACGINFSQGNGKVVEFYQAARDSKVPDISGATQSNGMTVINLLLLDSGNTSPAMAHQNPSDNLKLLLKGSKHDGNAYYTNTFLRFKSQRPRNTSP
jgi:hypothetical protein